MGDPFADLDPYRLPTDATPTRYDVRLRPALDDATFTGQVDIALDVRAALDHLVLNAADLDVEACELDGRPVEYSLDADSERLGVFPDGGVAPGPAMLSIRFRGVLNDQLRGFYRSTYLDADGVEQVIATTQMQSTDCRRAFPCWDEPAFKAVFAITLDVEHGLTAVSNSPEQSRHDDAGRTIIQFADTMPMSSYLVAFVVGRLETTPTIDVDGIPVRIIHVPGKGHLTGFGLEVAAFCLRWFQDYYEIPYPGDKVDLVALPDFAAGAMENLGCITFRESLLLVDPATSTQREQQLVADVVAHELAHMWFGDLVTMRWWNGIWLNEAFATFMEIAACDAFRPEWDRWTSFGLERSAAFEVDSLTSTRSVEYEVRSPADSEGMFDVLTYQKGGALLRMLEQYLGEERFREGVSHYLRTHAYGNTETYDLWDAIESTTGEPVRRLMDSWIWQPGYPLVSVRLDTDVAGAASVRLEQSRFRFGGGPGETAPADTAPWVVPIHVRIGATTAVLLLDDQPASIPLGDDDTAVVVVNAGGHGFLRVAYDDTLRGRLVDGALDELSPLERYGLVDDAWAATVAGRLPAADLLTFLHGFGDETEYGVWQAIVVALRGLARLVDGDAFTQFQAEVRSLVTPALARLGAPAAGERDLTGKLRGLLFATAGTLGADSDTVRQARGLFEQSSTHAVGTGDLDAELTAAATTIVASNGGADDYERMRRGVAAAATPQDQLRHLYALAEFDDAELAHRTCEFAFSPAVKTQNAPFLLRAALAHRHQGPLVWGFLREHWSDANERFPRNTIVRMVDSVKLLNTPEAVAEAEEFFAAHPIEQGSKTLLQILERQRVNAALRSRDEERFAAALVGGLGS